MRTQDLIDAQLDWAVAKFGREIEVPEELT